jgi:hypothetical protein
MRIYRIYKYRIYKGLIVWFVSGFSLFRRYLNREKRGWKL